MYNHKFFLPEIIEYPILLMQEFHHSHISNSETNHHSHYFIITTIDQHFILYNYDNSHNKLILCQMKRFQSPVCSVHFHPSTHQIYTGQFNGSLRIITIIGDGLQMENPHFKLQDSQSGNHIDFIYCSEDKQFCVGGSQQILILNNQSLQLLERFKFSSIISSSISFINPHSDQVVGCISFLNNKPPIIFDCLQVYELEAQYHRAIQHHSDTQEGEIIKMNYQGKNKDRNYLVCGVRQKNQESISVYTISKCQSNYYCERVYRFDLEEGLNVECLHIKNGALLLTMWNAYYIIDIQTRKVKNQNKREGSKFCWGFILDLDEKGLTCLLSKGFSHERPTDWKKKTCLHLSYRPHTN